MSSTTLKMPCPHHIPSGMSYQEWLYWLYQQKSSETIQVQCPECKRWYYPEAHELEAIIFLQKHK